MTKKFNYKKLPLKVNLTIWYMIILFLVLIFFSSTLYIYLERQLKDEVHSILELEMQNIKSEAKNSVQNNKELLNTSVNNQNIRTYFYNN
ncbi:MAG: hypothetical protein CI947_1280, partial [Halanaerobium sp.]